jgi:hypothetical protein
MYYKKVLKTVNIFLLQKAYCNVNLHEVLLLFYCSELHQDTLTFIFISCVVIKICNSLGALLAVFSGVPECGR